MGSHSDSNLEKPLQNAKNFFFANFESKSSMQISHISHICSFLSKPANQTWLAGNPPEMQMIYPLKPLIYPVKCPFRLGICQGNLASSGFLAPPFMVSSKKGIQWRYHQRPRTPTRQQSGKISGHLHVHLKKWKEDDIKSPTQKIFSEITIDNELHIPCCWSDVDPLLIFPHLACVKISALSGMPLAFWVLVPATKLHCFPSWL